MSSLSELSALELATAIRRREVSSVEVCRAGLEAAEALGPAVGAFVELSADKALETATRLDADLGIAAGSVLRGVPCPIKGLSRVAGLPSRCGSAATHSTPAEVDDGVVTRLAEAGTLMIGLTNVPEFGLTAYTEPEIAPVARTPWSLSRGAGGSSGGAAAAVSTGIVPIAHATDGGGSIRIPAGSCGLVGFKASRGLVSPGPHSVEGPGLSSHGVLTRTVADTAAGLDVLARGGEGNTFHAEAPVGGFLAGLDRAPGRLRIGVLARPSNAADAAVHPGCLRALDRASLLLAELGHDVVEAPAPYEPERWELFEDLWAVMAASIPIDPGHEQLLRPLTRHLRERGRKVSGVAYAGVLARVQVLTRDVARAWRDLDVVLTPTLAQPAAPVGSLRHDDDPERDFWDQTRFTPWGSTANLTGRPSVSLPLHREVVSGSAGDEELPFGIMLTGRWGRDDVLMRLARQIELADPWPSGPRSPASAVRPGSPSNYDRAHESR